MTIQEVTEKLKAFPPDMTTKQDRCVSATVWFTFVLNSIVLLILKYTIIQELKRNSSVLHTFNMQKMNKLFFTLCIITLLLSTPAFAVSWIWSKGYGGTNYDKATNIATDGHGYIYSTGYFNSSILSFGNIILNNSGSNDIFIVKHDTAGNVVWVQCFGGSGDDRAYGICTDPHGNVFVAGNFASDSISFGSITLVHPGFFIVKYDSSGTVLWAKDANGIAYFGAGNCIATDTIGNVCVTGTFLSSLTFGNTTLSNTGAPDIFIAKYDSSGNALWANRTTSNATDTCHSGGITTDKYGNIYITGSCGASTNFGVVWGTKGLYVAKYNSSGVFKWVKGAGGSGGGTGTGIAVTDSLVCITGWFVTTTLTVGGNTVSNANTGTSDILLATFDTLNGYVGGLWSAGGNANDAGLGMIANGGSIYVTGTFASDSISYPDLFSLGNTSISNTGGGNSFFVARFDNFFQVVYWLIQAGGTAGGDNSANGIAADAAGFAYITGNFSDTISFNSSLTSDSNSTDVFIAKVGGGCYSAPLVISGPETVCAGTTNTYSIPSVAGATSYTWGLPGGWYGVSSSNSISPTAGNTGGIVHVIVTYSGCVSAAILSVIVNQIPAQPGPISGPGRFCGDNFPPTYSVNPVPGATSYTWTLSPNLFGSSTTNSIVIQANGYGIGQGTISVTANNACGSSPIQTINIQVYGVPYCWHSLFTGPTPVCQGTTQCYNFNCYDFSYSPYWRTDGNWTVSNWMQPCFVIGATSGYIHVDLVSMDGFCTYYNVDELYVTVISNPPQPGAITGNTTVCANSSHTYSIAPVSGATSYTWTLPNGWTGSSNSTSITTTVGTVGGTISVVAHDTCGNSPARTLAVIVSSLSQPGVISGNSSPCNGTSQIYSILPVSGATSYLWTLPSSWTGSSTSNSISVIVGNTGGIISVTAIDSCGSSPVRNLNVTVDSIPPQPGIITGTNTVCQTSSQTYSITPVPGATSYTWTIPTGWTGTSTTNSINIIAGNNSGVITVVANNICGSSPPETLAVSILQITVPNIIASGDTSFCQNDSVVLYAGTFASYHWNTNSTVDQIVATTSGNYIVTVTDSDGCTGTASKTVVVHPNPIPIITPSGNVDLCYGDSVHLTSSVVNSYLWNTGATTPSINVSDSGNYFVSVTDTYGCIGISPVTHVSVHPLPTTTITPGGDTTFCQGDSVLLTSTLVNSYLWNTGATTQSIIVNASGDYFVSVTDINGCTGIATGTHVTVHPSPIVAITPNGDTTFCQGDSVLLTSFIDSSYVWNTGATTQSIMVNTSGNYFISVTDSNGCIGTALQTIIVFPFPNVTFTIPPTDTFVCENWSAFQLTGGSPTGGQYGGASVYFGNFNPDSAGVGYTGITYLYTDTSTGCYGIAFDSIHVSLCLDIPSFTPAMEHEIMLVPNPNDGSFTLHELSPEFIGNELRIMDVSGRIVFQQLLTKNSSITTNLQNGIYIWEILSENCIEGNGKLVIIK